MFGYRGIWSADYSESWRHRPGWIGKANHDLDVCSDFGPNSISTKVVDFGNNFGPLAEATGPEESRPGEATLANETSPARPPGHMMGPNVAFPLGA